ncbi:hypothetical protein NLU13_1769 [Sarocladium strictum]|uniref:Queuine tRNA-ribosyltransferase accessory subunit 2 n=1 Tax=Sarocladium strictum TaxID=5046 RepID=A0AA39GRK4_SARSR|nr:hypothetical protein NLU13_1769 [Sarocladium strictum]
MNEDAANMATTRVGFHILKSSARGTPSARLGTLSISGRKPIDTPNFVALTSRGIVPHLTQDMVHKATDFGAAHMALEDFIERKDPPIYETPSHDRPRLHDFTGFPPDRVTILGPRRSPPVLAPAGNVADSISVYTAFGFLSLSLADYAHAVERLQPDIAIGPADLPFMKKAPNSKKLIRMAERTEEWTDVFLRKLDAVEKPQTSFFAPVLPVELPIQWDYLRYLSEDVQDSLSGLAIYDTNMLSELTSYESLESLPKLSMEDVKSPRELLRQVSLGMDLCTVPFINNISDAGIALSFSFPAPEASEVLPLGINMWSTEHQTSLQPLVEGCSCYACTKHHRAFLQHLLNAKEMLGWNLLQAHNHHVISRFFEGIRKTLQGGSEAFEEACAQFEKVYEPELPIGTGQRPRARGHHFKSEADQKPFNAPAWSNLGGEDIVSESKQNGVETPLVPTESSATPA